jgi:quinoprotein glucose dehydrogenase
VDPESGILYVESQTRPVGMALVAPDEVDSDWNYVIAYQSAAGPQGLPLLKPPYRRITAIDLNKGEHAWQIPFGRGPVDHPAIRHLELDALGSPYSDVVAEGGILLTRSLLISYIAKKDELGDETATGSFLRAYDKATGELLAQVNVAERLHGALMTYMVDGRQFIAVAAGGRAQKGQLITLALPLPIAD